MFHGMILIINMKMLEVQKFIKSHLDWEKLLSEKPYCLSISKSVFNGRHLVMFKYNMVDSDFNEQIVRECRGLILDENTFEIVSFPFTKFFNFGEILAANVDWKTAKIGQKVDGSLVKIVNLDNELLISTNGIILADDAPIAQFESPYKSFGDLVRHVLFNKNIEISLFEPGYTYMFELVGPYNRIVIPYPEVDMYFLGKRNNMTFEETYFTDDEVFSHLFKIPKVYPLKTIDECIAATKAMPWDEEGYVVCDSKFNRIKIKSPSYVAVHHLRGEGGSMSYRRAIEIVRHNEIDEVCQYFQEFKPALEECKSKFWKLVEDTQNAWNEYLKIDETLPTRKDKALWITKNFKIPGIAFMMLDKKIESIESFFMNIPTDKLLMHLGYKE